VGTISALGYEDKNVDNIPGLGTVLECGVCHCDSRIGPIRVSGFRTGARIRLVLCVALLIHSWFMQRRFTRTPQRLVLLTLVLCLPALASIWLGLNVIRFYSYAPESDANANVYSAVIGGAIS
jgi:hypothetical protein